MLLLVLSLACGGAWLQPADVSPCAARAVGLEQDLCRREQIAALAPSQADQLPEIVARIQDPVVRDAAVLAWLDVNSQAISAAQGEAACALLDSRRAHGCRRRLQSAHLKR